MFRQLVDRLTERTLKRLHVERYVVDALIPLALPMLDQCLAAAAHPGSVDRQRRIRVPA